MQMIAITPKHYQTFIEIILFLACISLAHKIYYHLFDVTNKKSICHKLAK
jgi:hypothetical protein